MKGARLIVVTVLTTASLLVPIVLPVLATHSPFHIAHVRLWFFLGYGDWAPWGGGIDIDLLTGRVYRPFLELPGWLVMVCCAPLPVILAIVVQRNSKGREPEWMAGLWILFAAWLLWKELGSQMAPLVAYGVMLLLASAGSLRVKRIFFHLSATISALVPLAIALGVTASPIHLWNDRFWLKVDDDGVYVCAPSGSTFRGIAGWGWEWWEILGPCAFLLVLWISRMGCTGSWKNQNNRWKRMLLAGSFAAAAVSLMLLVLPTNLHIRFVIRILEMIGTAGAVSGVANLHRFLSRRRQSRAELGLCVHCGYNLTGNVSGVCPECGVEIAIADVPAPAIPWPAITNTETKESLPRRGQPLSVC